MIVRVVIAITFSLVAVTYAQLKNNRNRSQRTQNEDEAGDGKEIYTYADAQSAPKKEAEEEVKRVSSYSPSLSTKSFQENDQLLLPEFDDLLQGGVDFPSDSEKSAAGGKLKYDSDDSVESRKYESNSEDDEALEIFEALTSSNKNSAKGVAALDTQAWIDRNESAEVLQLKALVADLQQKEMRLESELLEYYGLKEQEESYLDLERQVRKKNMEIEKLNGKINALEDEAKKLKEELVEKENLKKELDMARLKMKDMQRTIQSDAGQTKAQLLILKQQVAVLQEREQEASKKDFELEKKLQTLKELEVEIMELRRTNKELQHEKRELTIKLAAAEAKISELSSMTENELVTKAQAEVSTLRLANEDLSKQVEGLQMNRFSEVEELVYLRWVNACLRYELRNYKAPPGKLTALDLGKSLSPRSQEKAKQLMMEYAGPDLLAAKAKEQSEHEYDSISSLPSTPSEGDLDDSSFDGQPVRHSGSKKSGLIRKLKKWGRGKEDSQASSASSSVDFKSSAGRMPSPGNRYSSSKGSLESLIQRSTSDSVAITTVGTNEVESGRLSASDCNVLDDSLPPVKTRRSVDMDDPTSNVAASFQLMSKSVGNVLEEKYPAFKDRHKLALEREKAIKEKAERARAEKMAEKFKSEPPSIFKLDKATPGKLSEKLKFAERGAATVSASERSSLRPEVNKIKIFDVQKRATRVPTPPPKASDRRPTDNNRPIKTQGSGQFGPQVPPPPPPPPPAMAPAGPPAPPPPPGSLKPHGPVKDKVQRAPEVVEFYQSLMRREAKKDTSMGTSDANVSDAKNNLIGEIENRSAFLLAVKADVETQGDFVQSLSTEVRNAAYDDIEDVIAFVSWLDEELSFLVDERAVLKHFEWPESKADALREAAFEYQDLKKLELEISSFEGDPHMPCEASLKKMFSLLEKVEQSVYALLRTRDMVIARYKEFNIPTQWMLDSGLIGKIKLASVQLARKYMKRVALELDATAASPAREPQSEFLLLQGVRFAFRVHQFAGGFDVESMRTFEELRDRVRLLNVEQQANDTSQNA